MRARLRANFCVFFTFEPKVCTERDDDTHLLVHLDSSYTFFPFGPDFCWESARTKSWLDSGQENEGYGNRKWPIWHTHMRWSITYIHTHNLAQVRSRIAYVWCAPFSRVRNLYQLTFTFLLLAFGQDTVLITSDLIELTYFFIWKKLLILIHIKRWRTTHQSYIEETCTKPWNICV